MTVRWRVVRHVDARNFLAAGGPLLERERAAYGGLIAWTRGLASGRSGRRPAAVFVTAQDARGTTGAVGLQRAHGPLVIGDSEATGAAALASFLADEGVDVPGVIGTFAACESFARAWRRSTGCVHRLRFHLRNYRLGDLQPLYAPVRGLGRPASADDTERIAAWLSAFIDEVRVPDDKSQLRRSTARRIAEGKLWLWVNGVPRALLGFEPMGEDAARIVSVYTPPQERGHGYGKALTAHVSRVLQERGCTDVFLSADLSNAVSNGLYASLGYVPVGDHYHFDLPAPEEG